MTVALGQPSAAPAQGALARLLASVVGFGFDGATTDWPVRPLGPHAWADLVASAEHERTIGLLSAALAAGALPATAAQADNVTEAHAAAAALAVVLEQLQLRCSRALDRAGVEHLVLKGSACAHLDWPDASLRSFEDVDLFIGGDYRMGTEVLMSSGCRRHGVEVHPNFDRRFGKGTTLVDDSGLEVDVHRMLAPGAYGMLVDRDELLDRSTTFLVGGYQARALGRPQRLLHACYHAALGDARPRQATLRDVGELVLACSTSDRSAVRDLARSWQGEAPVSEAVRSAYDLLGLPGNHPLVWWAFEHEPTPVERRRMAAYRGVNRGFAAKAFEGLMVLPTLRDRFAYTRYLLLPSADHLKARGETARHRWARGARLLSHHVRR